MPFVHFSADDIRWEGQADKWQKSDKATRGHCSTCGSCIYMFYHSKPEEMGILAGCIDEGLESVGEVQACIYVEEKPDWAELPKGVPTHARGYSDG